MKKPVSPMTSQLKDKLSLADEFTFGYMWYSNNIAHKIIKRNNFKKIDFMWQFEFDIYLDKKIVNVINKKNIFCNILSCNYNADYLYKRLEELGFKKNLVKVYSWPTYWFFHTYYSKKILIDNHIHSADTFENAFLCYNAKTKPHRTYLIDELYKEKLLDKGIVSYLQQGRKENEWKYYDGAILEQDIVSPSINEGVDYVQFDQRFIKSFLHVVTESDYTVTFISEKTVKPLILGLPFLVLSAPNFHKKMLVELGFKLYDEVFDYSFDNEQDLNDRIAGIIKNIKHIVENKSKLDDFYKLIKPKLLHNQKLALSYASDWRTFHFFYKNYIKRTTNKEFLHENEFNDLIHINRCVHNYKIGNLTKYTIYLSTDMEKKYL